MCPGADPGFSERGFGQTTRCLLTNIKRDIALLFDNHEALFTRGPSFPCARDTQILGISWLSLTYSFISRRVYKHARQLIPGARVSLVQGFPWQSNRETRVLGLSFSHVSASLGITRLPGKTSSWFPDLFWLVADDLLMLLSGNFLLGNRAKKSCPWRQGYPYFATFSCKLELSVSLGPGYP